MASSTRDSPKLRIVCNELDGVKYKAFEIGLQLGVPHGKMMQFKQEGKDLLTAAINFWLSGNVQEDDIPVSWSSIVAALKSEQVGEVGRAEAIRNKYCREQKDDKEPCASKSLDNSSDDDSMPPAKKFCNMPEEQTISEIDEKTKLCPSSVEVMASSSPDNVDAIDFPSTQATDNEKSYDIVMPDKQEVRKYQLELAQPGMNGENYIIVAPTGCGKTAVAALVISKHLKKGKGHVIFLVQNRVLAEQQDKKLSDYIPDADVDHCIGGRDLTVLDSIKYNNVTVCTAGKLLDELNDGTVTFDDVGLLMFDECHHATGLHVKEHNYAQVMYHYFEHREKKGHSLQVIGMTASPGAGRNPKVTMHKTLLHLKNLMAILNATSGIKIVTKNVDELKRFSSKSAFVHTFMKSREVEDDPLISAVCQEMERLEDLIPIEKSFTDKFSQKYLNEVSELKKYYEESDDKAVRDYISVLSLLVCYSQALKSYMELEAVNAIDMIETITGLSDDEKATSCERDINEGRKRLLKTLRSTDLQDNSFLEKMRELLWDDEKCEPRFSRGMVFVHTKKYAHSLCDWVQNHPNLGKEVKPVVITGHSGDDSTRQDKQKHIIEMFRKGTANLLITTSVAEEGLDIPDCNLVIRYHYVSTSVSKRQVEGRLRADDGQGFTILACDSRKKYTDLKNEELNKLVDKILITGRLPSGEELKREIQVMQHEILRKRRQEADEKVRLKIDFEEKKVTLICSKCKEFVCFGSDICTEGSHHVVPDPKFREKITVTPNANRGTFIVPNKIVKQYKMKCVKCSTDWGNICTFKDYDSDFPILKCENFTFKVDGKVMKEWSKWNKVTFEMAKLEDRMKSAED